MTAENVAQSRKRRLPKWLIAIGGLLFLCVITVAALGYYLHDYPTYVVLHIPLSPRSLYIEDSIESTFTWSDTGDKYFIWRREMTAYTPEYSTWETVVNYFEKYLTAQGWKRYTDDGFYPCNAYMPETNFLKLGQGGYIYFRPQEAGTYESSPTICLAVWPIEEPSLGFNVVLQTVNPSPWATMRSNFD